MRTTLSCALGLATLVHSALAFAYCRTTTCAQQNPPAECDPGQRVGSCQLAGLPLVWPSPCVSFSVQKAGSPRLGITADKLQEIVAKCFETWEVASCPDGGNPNLLVKTYPQVECNVAHYNRSEPNQNVWMFRDDAWPHEGDGDRTIALTLVSFNPKTGEIYDVDVELNSFARTFSLEPGGTKGDDLESVVQHESGHFLGLAHSDVSSATMWSNYNGSVDMRTLEPDDEAGICAVYPPSDNPVTDSCNADPRHGFSTKCNEASKGCSIGYQPTSGWFFGAALGLGLLLLGRRRQRAATE